MTPLHSSDVGDDFLTQLVADCAPGGLDCNPVHLVGCWMSESGLTARARNVGGFASGFFQAMPDTLRDVGFRGDAQYTEPAAAYVNAHVALQRAHATQDEEAVTLARVIMHDLDDKLSAAFVRLPLLAQLPYAKRYYEPHAGKMPTPGACYMATFTPAWLKHATEPDFVICSVDGENDAGGINAATSKEWYAENKVLDVNKDGKITPGDLDAKALAQLASPRGAELAARIAEIVGASVASTIPPAV